MAGKLIASIKLHYDKLIAICVILVLLGSLLYLVMQIGAVRSQMNAYEREINNLRPQYPDVTELDVGEFDAAMQELREPLQLSIWTNRLLTVPEARVWCVDCKRPIPYDVMVCPHCRADQPVPREIDDTYDTDGDGIPDSWEKKWGLDPYNPLDAALDLDGDGFTNLEEYRAGTDPSDAKNHPPIEDRIELERIDSRPFRLKFMSKMRMPNDNWRFGLNDLSTRKTHFVNIGDEVLGFVVDSFEQKTQQDEGSSIKRDISSLYLRSGRLRIPLVWQEEVKYQEHTVHLYFTLDNERFVLKRGDVFEIRGNKYVLMKIDSGVPSVVVIRVHDRKNFTIGEAEQESVNALTPSDDEESEVFSVD